VRANQLGRTYSSEQGFVLQRGPDALLAPDVAFVSAERVHFGTGGFLELVPDLAVEVQSTSETQRRVAKKTRAYLDSGVRLIWLVDPRRRTVRVVTLNDPERLLREGDELDGGDVLPGSRVAVAEVFSS
jgi:Uma2 family endonuclease